MGEPVRLPERKFATVPLGGGLDFATPPIGRNPGFAISAINIEPAPTQGYRRALGYDRFDGHSSPSQTKGYYLFITDGSLAFPSATGFPEVTWSGGSGVLLHTSAGDAFIGALTGPSLAAGETFAIGGQVFTLTHAPSRAARKIDDAITAAARAADWRRTFIGAVPGIGPVRCVVALSDSVFAIRDQSVSEAALFKATDDGWVAVGAMGKQFLIRDGYGLDDGDMQLINDASGLTVDVVAQLSGAGDVGTCTVAPGQTVALGNVLYSPDGDPFALNLSVALSQGATPTADTTNQYSNAEIPAANAAGWYVKVGTLWFKLVSYLKKTGQTYTIILDNPHGYTVPSNTTVSVRKMFSFAEVQTVSDMTLKAEGKYDTCVFNFFGDPSMRRAYLASGVQRAIELREDGRMVPLIANGDDADDKPSLVEAHADHLFLAYKGGFYIHSGPSNPLSWSGLLGAEQFAVGDEITGITTTAGGVLLVTCRNRTVALYGTSPTDWQQKVISESVGILAGTLQSTFIPVGLSERGLVRLDRVQEYGDFSLNLLDPSEKIQPIIEQFNWVGSSQVASANQYRLYSSAGRNLAIKINADGSIEATEVSYGSPVLDVWRYDEIKERQFFTLANAEGYVYELDEDATSFDGANINWLLRLAYAHFGSPQVRKAWRGVEFEHSVQGRMDARLAWSLDYRPGITSNRMDVHIDASSSGIWNYSNWNNFYWMSETEESSRVIQLDGTGTALSLALSGRSSSEPNFSITGMTVEYIPRRYKRG